MQVIRNGREDAERLSANPKSRKLTPTKVATLKTKTASHSAPVVLSEVLATQATTIGSPEASVAGNSHWQELHEDLKIPSPPKYEAPDTDEVKELKKKALKLWQQHDKHENEIAATLYHLCMALNAQGKKGAGFRAWLKKEGKPSSTAYRWINRYVEREKVPSPFPTKNEKKGSLETAPTSSQMGQSSGPLISDTAPYIPPPTSVLEATNILYTFLEKISATKRLECALELKNWMETYISRLNNVGEAIPNGA